MEKRKGGTHSAGRNPSSINKLESTSLFSFQLPASTSLEIKHNVAVSDSRRSLELKSLDEISQHRMDAQDFKSLNRYFSTFSGELRKNQVFFHSVNDERTSLEKINTDKVDMFV